MIKIVAVACCFVFLNPVSGFSATSSPCFISSKEEKDFSGYCHVSKVDSGIAIIPQGRNFIMFIKIEDKDFETIYYFKRKDAPPVRLSLPGQHKGECWLGVDYEICDGTKEKPHNPFRYPAIPIAEVNRICERGGTPYQKDQCVAEEQFYYNALTGLWGLISPEAAEKCLAYAKPSEPSFYEIVFRCASDAKTLAEMKADRPVRRFQP